MRIVERMRRRKERLHSEFKPDRWFRGLSNSSISPHFLFWFYFVPAYPAAFVFPLIAIAFKAAFTVAQQWRFPLFPSSFSFFPLASEVRGSVRLSHLILFILSTFSFFFIPANRMDTLTHDVIELTCDLPIISGMLPVHRSLRACHHSFFSFLFYRHQNWRPTSIDSPWR